MKVAIHTLGCKVNQVETQAMESLLLQRGHTLVPFEDEADAYIINSCTVTASSDRKSRRAVYQAQRRREGAVVALCGCYPQVSREEANSLSVDLIGGTGERTAFLALLEQVWQDKQARVVLDEATTRRVFEALPGGGGQARTRAMLKVEDGCANFCSYCVIPYARGPVRSLPLVEAVREAARLEKEGYHEIVLTGIELSSWGCDLEGEPGLGERIERVAAAAPSCRIRLGSLEPRTITREFCQRMASVSNLCPHFHLSLQSGCDDTLLRMRRRYDTARYLESVQLLREHFDRPGITTDLIVGFPGETEEHVCETLQFIERCAFSDMHVFAYSPRKGTRAASMPGQVPNKEKARRAVRAKELASGMRRAFLFGQIGRELSVLLENKQGDAWYGHAGEYVPVLVSVNENAENLKNCLCPVRVTAAGETVLYAERIDKESKA